MAKKSNLPEREALESLAEEMNKVMGLEPEIKFGRKVTDEELIKVIRKEAKDIVADDFVEDPEDDEKEFFSEDAADTLKALGCEIPEEEEKEKEEEEEEEKEEKGKGKGKGKAAGKGKEEKEEKEEKGKSKGKAAASPAKKDDKKSKEKDTSYNRYKAIADAVDGGATDIEKIVSKADALYEKHGGKGNNREQAKVTRDALKVLVAFGFGEIDGKKFTLKD